MKRAWFLGVLAAVLLVAALPAVAATTLGTSGEVTYGIISNGTATSDAWVNAYMNLNATVDPNNMVVLGLMGTGMPTVLALPAGETGQMFAAQITNFYLKSDIGGALGLDTKTIDPVLYGGYGVFDLPDYNVTQYGTEGIAAMGVDNGYADGIFGGEIGSGYGLIGLNTSVMGMVNIVAAASGTAFNAPSATNKPQAMAGAYTTIGPVSAEAGWAMQGTTNGYIPLGVKVNYTTGSIGLAAMGQYVANLNTNGVSNWAAGAAVTYASNYTVDFAVLTWEPTDQPNGAMKATGDVVLNFAKNFGVIGSYWLNFDPLATSVFDTAEVSAWTTFGPAKLRVGYLYGTQATAGTYVLGTPNLNAPGTNNKQGGVFVTTDLSF